MSTVTKKLECIGDDCIQFLRQVEQFERMFFPYSDSSKVRERAWVAIIKDYDKRCSYGGFLREFLRGNKDYSEANSKGSRGVYKYYYLEEGYIYEVSEPTSWKNTNRYFCRVENGEEIEMSKEEVIAHFEALRKQPTEYVDKQTGEIMSEEEFLKWLRNGS